MNETWVKRTSVYLSELPRETKLVAGSVIEWRAMVDYTLTGTYRIVKWLAPAIPTSYGDLVRTAECADDDGNRLYVDFVYHYRKQGVS